MRVNQASINVPGSYTGAKVRQRFLPEALGCGNRVGWLALGILQRSNFQAPSGDSSTGRSWSNSAWRHRGDLDVRPGTTYFRSCGHVAGRAAAFLYIALLHKMRRLRWGDPVAVERETLKELNFCKLRDIMPGVVGRHEEIYLRHRQKHSEVSSGHRLR